MCFTKDCSICPFMGDRIQLLSETNSDSKLERQMHKTYIPQLIVAGSVVDRRSTLSLQTQMAEVGILEEEEEAEMEVDSVK